jgi:hypothetical protein
LLIVPVVLPTEGPGEPNPLPRLYASGISDWTGHAYWGEFLPELSPGPEGTLAAVAVGSEATTAPQAVPPEATPAMPEAGLLETDLPRGTGLGADLERLLVELNDLGSGIKNVVGQGQFALWLLAGSLAVAGCEIARRRAREQLGLTAADAADLRWFPELA